MWSSIKQIIKPENLNDALSLQKDSTSHLFAGGSYLVSQKQSNIQTLLDINHLLDTLVESKEDGLLVGAGATLQEIFRSTDDQGLRNAIIASCPSKNIRNQRTLGGEIAQARPDSDLLIYLHAAEAKILINDSDIMNHLASWEGDGIISAVSIPKTNTKLERVSVLDSAPAFVIAAVNQTAKDIILAIGGKCSRILYCKTPLAPDEEQIRTFMEKVENLFEDDHFGSPAYKRQLVSNLLTEMTVNA